MSVINLNGSNASSSSGVATVNGDAGPNVTLTASDVGADASGAAAAAETAAKSYADGLVANVWKLKGDLDASTNPNYPAATAADAYVITVAGKVGGASGTSVDVGDVVACKTTNAGGTQAAVGSSWFIIEHNLTGVMLAANNLSDVANATTAKTNLGIVTPSMLLDFDQAADLADNVAVPTGASWADLCSNQTIAVAGTSSNLLVAITGNLYITTGSWSVTLRAIIDSAGTPVTKTLRIWTMTSGSPGVQLNSTLLLNGLAAGNHTIKLQIQANGAGAYYYQRAAYEFLRLQVLQA